MISATLVEIGRPAFASSTATKYGTFHIFKMFLSCSSGLRFLPWAMKICIGRGLSHSFPDAVDPAEPARASSSPSLSPSSGLVPGSVASTASVAEGLGVAALPSRRTYVLPEMSRRKPTWRAFSANASAADKAQSAPMLKGSCLKVFARNSGLGRALFEKCSKSCRNTGMFWTAFRSPAICSSSFRGWETETPRGVREICSELKLPRVSPYFAAAAIRSRRPLLLGLYPMAWANSTRYIGFPALLSAMA